MSVLPSQKRAVSAYRSRLMQRGISRFEVSGRQEDRRLIRELAKRLAEDGVDAEKIRAALQTELGTEGTGKGGILAALRRSPLVGADIESTRSRMTGRKADL